MHKSKPVVVSAARQSIFLCQSTAYRSLRRCVAAPLAMADLCRPYLGARNLFRIDLAARLHGVAVALHGLAVNQGFASGQGFRC